jgi:hypothetical protein
MIPLELHPPIRETLKNWGAGVILVAVLLGVYAGVQLYEDNVILRAQVQTMKARGCPGRLQGKILAGDVWQDVDLSRPKFSTLRCYYQAGVRS